ncbi:MAG: sigma-70 family RNA polymerase sigma factor, partial [Candidatus Latescibacterota bacterium]
MPTTGWTELAVAARGGDLASFRMLVESATRTLIALAYRYTRDWETARDLTQETWIKVHRGLRRYDPGRPFQSWLYAVHRNTCLSHLRSAAVKREVPTAPRQLADQIPASATDRGGALVERREFRQRLDYALSQLTDGQRNVVTKVLIEQVPQREAAESLGMSFTTLRTTL